MPKEIIFGIFGGHKIIVDDDGFVEIPVMIQESGLFAGRPPDELRFEPLIFDESDFNKQYVAKMNRKTDLPYYLAKAKVKIIGPLEKITDEDIIKLGLKPLEDKKDE